MDKAAGHEFMVQALTALLDKGEVLTMPFYGTIAFIDREWVNYLAFMGVAGEDLLVAVLHPLDKGMISRTMRRSLVESRALVRRLWVSRQYAVKLTFADGEQYHIRFTTRISDGDFVEQEANTAAFLQLLQKRGIGLDDM